MAALKCIIHQLDGTTMLFCLNSAYHSDAFHVRSDIMSRLRLCQAIISEFNSPTPSLSGCCPPVVSDFQYHQLFFFSEATSCGCKSTADRDGSHQ